MTPVEISEKIRDHLIKQNARAQNRNGSCRYRGIDGLSCAVGCLIKDEFYNANEIEGHGVFTYGVRLALNKSGILFSENDPIQELLGAWQSYHDSADGYIAWLDCPDVFPSPQSTHERLMEAFGI